MNMKLSEVTITSPDGKFCKSPEVFLRGNNIKSIQLIEDILEKHIVEMKRKCKYKFIFWNYDDNDTNKNRD